jgi:hypothetical protein
MVIEPTEPGQQASLRLLEASARKTTLKDLRVRERSFNADRLRKQFIHTGEQHSVRRNNATEQSSIRFESPKNPEAT